VWGGGAVPVERAPKRKRHREERKVDMAAASCVAGGALCDNTEIWYSLCLGLQTWRRRRRC